MDSIKAGAHRLDDGTTIYVCDCSTCLHKTGGQNTQVSRATCFRHKPTKLATIFLPPLPLDIAPDPPHLPHPPVTVPCIAPDLPHLPHPPVTVPCIAPDPPHLLHPPVTVPYIAPDLPHLPHPPVTVPSSSKRPQQELDDEEVRSRKKGHTDTPELAPSSSFDSQPIIPQPESPAHIPDYDAHGMVNDDIDPKVEASTTQMSQLLMGSTTLQSLWYSPPLQIPDILRHPSLERELTPPPSTNKGKDKEVPIVEVKNPLSNLVLKPQPKAIPRKAPTTSVDSSTSSSTSLTSGDIPTAITPPSNGSTSVSIPDGPSSTDTASLAVKVELLAANKKSTPITTDSKPRPEAIKKCQPSTKPMCVSAKITAQNLCALDWQMNRHQRDPASVFAMYWNSLSNTNKEVYKHKAVLQLNSSGAVQEGGTGDDADEE
ncbi:uncharacterized protein EDB91DRAFT_1255243 [Suillus paluster]|uniref:uncharacterized protein n=1 Tax=Suillus paluster TaxID=48578 RepID=UPI001B85B730|nr:uncharacterized protein EDB91DRAFT_1255243 [Suillus paluster]KAG1724380.1 hypothetical protein EDB91DRAFT_1255243 [Suillus paluster]